MRTIGVRLATLWLTLVVALSWLPVTDAIAAKSGPGISGAIGPTVTIDNGIVGDNRLEVGVGAGGEASNISFDPSGPDGLQNLIFELNHYVDAGADGGAVQLGNTTISQPPTPSGANQVTSGGSFAGPNADITWTAVSSIAPGSNTYVTSITFVSTAAFGAVRLIQYLDGDVPDLDFDRLIQVGTFGDPGFSLVTQSSENAVGLAQGAPAVVGATCVGWAGSPFSDLRTLILNAGTTYSPAGNIIDLAPTKNVNFIGAPTWGPTDITSAIACDLDPNATTAVITLSILALQTPGSVPTLSQWAVIVMIGLLIGAAVWRLRGRSLRPAI
jgi:hypothetical protein